MEKDAVYLEKCRQLIEKKLQWGDSATWQNQDFESLSEKIFNETKVSLSASTLKRLWGKVNYTSSPNLTTLNALAQFAGFENWRKFISALDAPAIAQAPENILKKRAFKIPLAWIGACALMMVMVISILAFRKSVKILKYGSVTFNSSAIAEGLPNTVMFRYSADDSNADSVFIQQSWDPRLRFKVNKFNNEFASTYYYPGYYRAKLLLNDSIVREHDVYVRTKGWLGTIDKSPIPIYIEEASLRKNDYYSISEAHLKQYNIDTAKVTPLVSIFKVEDFGDLRASDFTLETALRSNFNKSDAVCQKVNLIVLCSNGYYVVPLSIKGCVGELNLVLNGERFDGQVTDLSAFGVDFADWVSVKVQAEKNQMQILVNGKTAFQQQVSGDAGKIVGLRFQFRGGGEVKNTKLNGRLLL